MATINGTSGNDTLYGTTSADTINGLDGDDTLFGYDGDDWLDGGLGADTMYGGLGNDYYIVDDAGDVVDEASGEGNDTVRTTLASYILTANVEYLEFVGSGDFTGEGNELNNQIYGAAGNDVLYGYDGHDALWGNDGDDSLYGGSGHDTLIGGLGADYMEGNDGDDAYMVDDVGDTVVELSGEGDFDIVYTSVSTYTLPNEIENLYWNSYGSFNGTGNALNNIINSGGSNDVLSGGDGDDELRSSAGNDILDGGDGNDYLNGSAGADTYTGGAGSDLIQIGFFESGNGVNADRITDFATGVDTIDVSLWDANRLVAGNQAFTWIGGSAFSGTAGELRTYFDGVDTWVQADRNGDMIADFEILFDGSVSLAGSDFIL
ncbi:MAG TPA: calcium-binding protein [Allosphingosinicella sp.]|jgi:Ca2+-binding RTX toxin-like protein|nr:calcium-binding protein [Allosphingosinicella sp.]